VDHLHEQKFASFLINFPSDIMRTCLHLCASLRAGVWLLIHPTTPTFHLSPTHFLTSLHTHFGLPHPTMAHLSWCQCGHTINNLGTHLLQCPYGNECTTTHNTLRDVIATIALENGTHVQKEVSHFPSPHPMTNQYPYHQRELSNFDGHHHC